MIDFNKEIQKGCGNESRKGVGEDERQGWKGQGEHRMNKWINERKDMIHSDETGPRFVAMQVKAVSIRTTKRTVPIGPRKNSLMLQEILLRAKTKRSG